MDRGWGGQIKIAFSQPQQITVHNLETYTNVEDTTLQSYGVWTQVDGSPNQVVTGLGSSTISPDGANGASGPFCYGHWTTTTTACFMTYEFNETAGGSAGNEIDIYVPEPALMSVGALLFTGMFARRRPRKLRKQGEIAYGPMGKSITTLPALPI